MNWFELSVKVDADESVPVSSTTIYCPLESESLAEEPAFSNFARADERLDVQVGQFWKLETSEALANSFPQFSVEDKRAVDIWERSVAVADRHYDGYSL